MIKDDIINELQFIPENKLIEIYDLIHYFRLGLDSRKEKQAEEDLKIDTKMCLKTLEKIKQKDFSGFSEIENIDEHIKNLRNEIN